MIIGRHPVSYWIENGAVDVSIKGIEGAVTVHRHEFYEIELILEGGGVYNIDGIDYPISRGKLFVMSPISYHKLNFDKNTRLINLMFTLNCDNLKFLSGLFANAPHFVLDLRETDIEFIRVLAEETVKNLKNNNRYTDYTAVLLNCVLGKISSLKSSESFKSISVISEAVLYIQNHFTEPITLEEVAKISNYSPNYFGKQFKQNTGISFKQYVADLRFAFAKELLKNSSLSVTQISHQSGFNDFSYFMTTFKAKYGVTPKQFREMT